MKKIYLTSAALLNTSFLLAQNVGIGINNPTKRLSVNGSIVVDHDNKNNGTLDSASLLFGASPAITGITSNKTLAAVGLNGLDLWTNGLRRISILSNGNVGVGTVSPQFKLHVSGTSYFQNELYANNSVYVGSSPFNSSYKLQVNNGNSYFDGTGRFTGNLTAESNLSVGANLFVSGFANISNSVIAGTYVRSSTYMRADERLSIAGAPDDNYRLRVYDGNARIGGDFHATGNAAVGGTVDGNFRFRVYDGNSRFGGDVQVTGALSTTDFSVANNFTIGGKGSVKSNGTTPLKIHFLEVYTEVQFTGVGQLKVFNVSLPDFDSHSDVRLSISHFVPVLPSGDNPHNVTVTFTEFNPASNSCVMVARALPNVDFILAGTYYIMAVMKDN
jgi:hypothetical protein